MDITLYTNTILAKPGRIVLTSYSDFRLSLTYLHVPHMIWRSGGRLNKKDGLTRYGDSHVKDKTS